MRPARRFGRLGLPWWWWAYGTLLVIDWIVGTVFPWIVEHDRLLEGIAAIIVIIGAAIAFVPWVRNQANAGWRFLRSLPARFPLRVVRTNTLAVLRANQREEPQARLLTLRERCEKVAHEIGDEVAKRMNLPFLARQRVGDSYRAFLPELRQLRELILRDRGYLPAAMDWALGIDLSGEQALEVRGALLGIDWGQN